MVITTTTRMRWDGEAPPVRDRVVVVAPHPDDEVLGMAGLLVHLQSLRLPLCIVAVTDGEASHAQSTLIAPTELRTRRDQERTEAMDALGVTAELVRLGLPDGAVRAEQGRLADALEALVDDRTLVIAPWRHDGHPDHEAAAAAAHRASEVTGAALWEVPIWAKVEAVERGSRPPGRSSLVLSPAMRSRKRQAVACYRSQLVGLSDDPIDGPVVRPRELEAMLNGREEVLWT
jgi:LmbE family N-acetylglucosaminyl deacetylase